MNGPQFAIFNHEAHNSAAPEYEATLLRMHEKMVLRMDMAAPPDRADGPTPESEMIYEYLRGARFGGAKARRFSDEETFG